MHHPSRLNQLILDYNGNFALQVSSISAAFASAYDHETTGATEYLAAEKLGGQESGHKPEEFTMCRQLADAAVIVDRKLGEAPWVDAEWDRAGIWR